MTKITLLTQAQVAPFINKLGATAKQVQADIHIAACSTLDHTREHGDYTGAQLLMNALPNGQRVKALGAWFSHFSNKKLTFKYDKETATWIGSLEKARMESDFGVDAAMITSFADLTAEKDPMTLDVKAFVHGLERTAKNTATFDGTDKPKVDPTVRQLAADVLVFIASRNKAA